jgi:prepilin-type N-terminal cleavage/methylation domain-containing protein/prepilin-type processing-associated H-X9-DG protein
MTTFFSNTQIAKTARTRSGFTLVELLVVTALIAVLGTLVVMGARIALRASHEAKCMSNLRNIGVALYVYADDHGGSFPQTSHTERDMNRMWVGALEDYLGDYDETRICPADPRAKERLAAGGTSYILNSFLFVPEVGPWGEPTGPPRNRPSLIPEPGRTILAFICADRWGIGPDNDHTHSNLWSSWPAVTADIAPGRFRGGKLADDTGRANYLFADGRVESIPAAIMKRKTESGINIAQLPGL